jgi:glycosyltransferase involved in cell wall biosynthesis
MDQTERWLRALVVFEYGTLNGGENSMLALLEPLRAQRVEVVALGPPNSPLSSKLKSAGVAMHPLSLAPGRPPDNAQLAESLRSSIDGFNVDLVHSNSLSMSRRVGRVRNELPVPCVAHLRDIIRLSKKAVNDLNQNNLILAVSEATRSYHVAQGLDAQRCEVLHNGVDLEQFHCDRKSSVRVELGIPQDDLLLTAIGQIGIRKGLDVLLEAFESVLHSHSNARLLVVGRRFSEKDEAIAYESELHRVAELGSLTGRVQFCGLRDDIPDVLGATDLLVHSARQEPLGRVLLEAAASGLPIVATDVGGAREIFPSNSQASLCPANDAAALASAIISLLGNPKLRQQLGVQARLRAETAFSTRRAAQALAEQYRLASNT